MFVIDRVEDTKNTDTNTNTNTNPLLRLIMFVIDRVEDTTKRRLESSLNRPQALCGLFATTLLSRGGKKYKSDQFHK